MRWNPRAILAVTVLATLAALTFTAAATAAPIEDNDIVYVVGGDGGFGGATVNGDEPALAQPESEGVSLLDLLR
jgi:hypothetical protein